MNKNTENIRIDEVLEELYHLREENQDLKMNNDFLQRKLEQKERIINGIKLNNAHLTLERNKLCDKCMAQSRELHDIKNMSMWEFGSKYCSEDQLEEDGRLFARELLGTRVTGEYKDNEKAAAIAEEVFIANGEALYERTWNLNGGDDF